MSGEQELTSLYVKTQTYVLNAHPSHPFSNLNIGDNSLYLKSDTDEQLLIHIVFQTAVRISAMSLKSAIDESTPTSVKIFANLTSPGFTDINDTEPSQVVVLVEGDIANGKKIILKQVKFQRVNSLTLFFDENQGGEFTTLSALKFYGFTLDGLDVGTIHTQHTHSHDHDSASM